MFDLIIRNGFVVDGTGHLGIKTHVAVLNGRIAYS
jgi:N-acyl-D-aspartate/D-glutamate deacylase